MARPQFTALHTKYVVREWIGSGALGMVLRVSRKKDGCEFAAKVVAKAGLDRLTRVALAREVAVFHHVKHPNIVQLEETIEDAEYIYIITELLAGGNLRSRLSDMAALAVPHSRIDDRATGVSGEYESLVSSDSSATDKQQGMEEVGTQQESTTSSDELKEINKHDIEPNAQIQNVVSSAGTAESTTSSVSNADEDHFVDASAVKVPLTFSRADLLNIALQMLSAVSYLHARGMAHRDIKLDNFVFQTMLDDKKPVIKLLDFGMVYWRKPGSSNMHSRHRCGTLGFCAPEVCNASSYVPERADMWSLGVVLHAMSLRRMPFPNKNDKALARDVARCHIAWNEEEWHDAGLDMMRFVQSLLLKNPDQRPSAAEACETVLKMSQSLNAGLNVQEDSTTEDRINSSCGAAERQSNQTCENEKLIVQVARALLSETATQSKSPDGMVSHHRRQSSNNSLDDFVEFLRGILIPNKNPPSEPNSSDFGRGVASARVEAAVVVSPLVAAEEGPKSDSHDYS